MGFDARNSRQPAALPASSPRVLALNGPCEWGCPRDMSAAACFGSCVAPAQGAQAGLKLNAAAAGASGASGSTDHSMGASKNSQRPQVYPLCSRRMKSDNQGQAGTGGGCTTNYDTPTTIDMVRNVGGTLFATSVGFLVCHHLRAVVVGVHKGLLQPATGTDIGKDDAGDATKLRWYQFRASGRNGASAAR